MTSERRRPTTHADSTTVLFLGASISQRPAIRHARARGYRVVAVDGDPDAFAFPTASRVSGLNFSFAGLKTALLYRVRDLGDAEAERCRADLAASYQRAIVESLALRVERALAQTGLPRLAVGGGVAANGVLRERLGRLGVQFDVPSRELCTDNAAMIASAARYVPQLSFPAYLELDAYANGERAAGP